MHRSPFSSPALSGCNGEAYSAPQDAPAELRCGVGGSREDEGMRKRWDRKGSVKEGRREGSDRV